MPRAPRALARRTTCSALILAVPRSPEAREQGDRGRSEDRVIEPFDERRGIVREAPRRRCGPACQPRVDLDDRGESGKPTFACPGRFRGAEVSGSGLALTIRELGDWDGHHRGEIGVAILLLSRLGVHPLPGDIVIHTRHFTLYVPGPDARLQPRCSRSSRISGRGGSALEAAADSTGGRTGRSTDASRARRLDAETKETQREMAE